MIAVYSSIPVAYSASNLLVAACMSRQSTGQARAKQSPPGTPPHWLVLHTAYTPTWLVPFPALVTRVHCDALQRERGDVGDD